MNRILYLTGVICVLIVAVIFTVNTFTEPITASVAENEYSVKNYTVKEFFAVADTAEAVTNSKTNVRGGENPQKEESAAETILEPFSTVVDSATLEPEEGSTYYEIPLSEGLQDCIFAECGRYGIPPAIVIAMIERESSYDTYAMGDDGRSFGLMQIQPKWHLQKMIAMDCTDLFEPYQNVKVGIAILGELMTRYNDISRALTAYNGSEEYAGAILALAEKIENMR